MSSMHARMTVFAFVALIVFAILIIRHACLAQVSSTPPDGWHTATLIGSSGISALRLSHNRPEAIRQEILDPKTIQLIAQKNGLRDADLATVRIAQEPGYDWVQVYQLGNSEKAFPVLSDQLRKYVEAREEGHTRAFVLAALTNRVELSRISDPGLRVLATNEAFLPVSWLKKAGSSTTTNKAGEVAGSTVSVTIENGKSVTHEVTEIPKVDEVCRWVYYSLVDGEIAWLYTVRFRSNGRVDCFPRSKCDAKEYDPKYKKVMKTVDKEVHAEMKRLGVVEKFGSVHTYWSLKRENLKRRGIEWRSPSELNPNCNYD